MTYKKKLIEVALPLEAINDASAYDKMPGIGPHPKGIHHWWARLPLPTARAVLFASVVDDPSEHPEMFPTEETQNAERDRLFGIIRRMMQKKLHEHPEVYAEARAEMFKHCDGKLPPVLDPFAGGGSIPLEANRLGFEAYARDLNPIAVLLNKCNLEIAPRWTEHPAVNPESREQLAHSRGWKGTHGLAEDVRYYGRKIRDETQMKIGHLYPKVRLPKEYGNEEANVIAWLWARTVASPNPAARGAHIPLISTYWLSTAKGKPAWLRPIVDKAHNTYRFEVETGEPPDRSIVKSGTKLGRGAKFKCLLTDQPIDDDHIKQEALAGRLGCRLLAIVAERKGGRAYLAVTETHETAAKTIQPDGILNEELANDPRNIWCIGYGLTRFKHLFTPRQMTAMITLCDCVKANHTQVLNDARAAGLNVADATGYANTITVFLALAADRTADFNNALCRWTSANQKVMNLFGRQAIPMVWDFAEANSLGDSVGAWSTCSNYVADCIEVLGANATSTGYAVQMDAANGTEDKGRLIVSTDPPYYDNISYAGLSDFFYVWLRRTAGKLYPELFTTVLVPKMPELTASPERFDGDKEKARDHFEAGFRSAFTALRKRLDPRFPLTVYYAFKQEDEESDDSETERTGTAVNLTTGWETLLNSLLFSGFEVTGTWPVRASQAWRMVSMGTNALASYIVLACRARPNDAGVVSRRDFLAALKRELPDALRAMQKSNIAPVDLAQAAIGPGMAVFSRYARVLETNGSAMTVRAALTEINKSLDEVLAEQEGEFDADTRWALAWFDQNGFNAAAYGMAETLCTAKNTSVQGMKDAGILEAKGGKVRLLKKEELDVDWNPATDNRLTIWEITHHLIRRLEQGESGAAELIQQLGAKAEVARDLSYRLYTICERRKWAQEAIAYNTLVLSWGDVQRLAEVRRTATLPTQTELI
jgi:putative DNA methylase